MAADITAPGPARHSVGDVVKRVGARPHGDPPWLPAYGLVTEVGEVTERRPYLLYFAGGHELQVAPDEIEPIPPDDDLQWFAVRPDLLLEQFLADWVRIETYEEGGLGADPRLIARHDRLAPALDAYGHDPDGTALEFFRENVDGRVRELRGRLFPLHTPIGVIVEPALAQGLLVDALARASDPDAQPMRDAVEGALCAWYGGLEPDELTDLLQPLVLAQAAQTPGGAGAAPAPESAVPGPIPPTAAGLASRDFPPGQAGPAAPSPTGTGKRPGPSPALAPRRGVAP
jgi:hypothetical protein